MGRVRRAWRRASMASPAQEQTTRTPARPEPPAHLNALLARAGRGDKAAFRQLYEATAPQLFALCLRLLRERSLAEEALQEGFLDAWRGAATFRPERGHALGWLATVVRNRAIRLARRQARGAPVDDAAGAADQPSDERDALDRLADLEDERALAHCLRELSEHERRAILLAFYQGLSHGDIARRTSRPVGTVKSWIRRGLNRLRRCLDEAP